MTDPFRLPDLDAIDIDSPPRPLGTAGDATPTRGHGRRTARRGALARLYRLSRALCVLGAVGAATLVGAALVGAVVGATWARLAIPLCFAILLPWVVRLWLRRRLQRRFDQRLSLGGWWLYVAWNAALIALLCLGFSHSTGRALRRRGDFWLGAAEGPLADAVRRKIARVGRWMERFDAPAEQRAIAKLGAGDASGRPGGDAKPKPGNAKPALRGTPATPATPAVPGAPVAVTRVRWVHPLPGPRRRMPPNASCRFGARRPGRRPAECQLGHCGVDLAGPIGLPVFAIADATVKSIVRDPSRGGIAGRYVILLHRGRTVKSKYIHLHTIRADLRRGQRVRAGERVGTLGHSGFDRGGAHLHFAVAVRRGAGWHYIDPEPLLYIWRLQPRRAGAHGRRVARRGV